MLPALLLAGAAYAASPLEIHVPPDITLVQLDCGGKKFSATPTAGVATFQEAPTNCKVIFTRAVGQIPGPGIFTCNNDGCTMDDVPHAAISDGAGKVNLVLTGSYDTQWLELTCPDGYRQRGDIKDNTTTFSNVKDTACTLYFKGATPAQYRPVAPGSYRCSLTGTTAVCTSFKP